MIFIQNNALLDDVTDARAIEGRAARLAFISEVLDILYFIQFSGHDKSIFISQLTKSKS